MKLDIEPLMDVIGRYLAKADEELEKTLEEEGFTAADIAVGAINRMEEDVTDALEERAKKLLERIKAAEDVEEFLEKVWPDMRDEETLEAVLKEMFREQFEDLVQQFTYHWMLGDAPDVAEAFEEDERITEQTQDFISGWSSELAELMHLSTNDQIEKVLRRAQQESMTVSQAAELIAESGIRQPGYRARRVALTEVLRMESYSQLEAMIQNPLAYKKRWVHHLSNNPRENHMAVHGQEVFKREAFALPGGYAPQCPRDTCLPPEESINCHCTMEVIEDESALGMTRDELRESRQKYMDEADAEWEKRMSAEDMLRYAEPDTVKNYFENLENGGTIKVNISSEKQFGKKAGKHCQEFGLNPASEEGRKRLKSKISDIVYSCDEVRRGTWRGQKDEVLFYLKNDDVVLTKQNGDFITVMKGAAKNNAGVKNAGKQ